ncbi:MAG: hypothetical protein ACI959_001580 [Limisphaerales bacterium]|jgi:hypothetical protein
MWPTIPLVNYRDPLETVSGIGLIDLLVIPFYLLIIFIIANIIRHHYYEKSVMGKYLIWGLSTKIAAGFAFAAVYVYYYDSRGDTFFYFDGAKAIFDAFIDSPLMFFKVLFTSAGDLNPDTIKYTSRIPTFWKGDTEQVFMTKILGVFLVLSFKTYWLATVLFTTVCFTGLWKLYTVFRDLYPDLEKPLFYTTIMIPSALFWGSGILKDTVCLGCLGWLVWSVYNLLIKRRNIAISTVILVITSLFIMQLKAYILLSFIPATLIWVYTNYRSNSNVLLIKYTLTPIFIGIIGVAGVLLLNGLSTQFQGYSLESIEKTTKGFHSFHGALAEQQGQSGYSLGNIDYSPIGMLKKAPAAVNVTFFRPYPWEVQDPFQALSSIESLCFFLFFLYTLFRVGVFRFLRYIIQTPVLAMSITFAVMFGFAVGFSAYNFGALVRFKIPGLPFMLVSLIIINHIYSLDKDKNKAVKLAIKPQPKPIFR